jgi:dihydroorotate dehydrogenase (NAD+) catalytic subunit
VKISSNVNDIGACALAAENGGADAIVAINTVKAMKIDIVAKMPVLGNKVGGYSGKAIKPIGVRSVYDIFPNISIPIIGCGGITTGEDAIEYVMAGASAIQIGSAIYYRGIDVFQKICDEITQWMEKNNYTSINQFKGVAHE